MADEEQATQPSDTQRDKREQRAMWIFSAIIVLLILGGMGANMLFHKDQGPTTDISSQSRTAPQQ
jgi:flagellar basal body-associated protein FliL